MPSDYDNELVRTAIIHFKAGEFDLAQRYLERALDVADDYDTRAKAAWYMGQMTDDPAQKRRWLEDVLAFDRGNSLARRELAILDGRLKREDIINPDKLAQQTAGEVKAASADRFTCPSCGARMVFAPDGRSLYCEHCSQNQVLDAGKPDQPEERDFVVAMATQQGHRKAVAMHTFNCKGCGASFILPPAVISATCSYCNSPHVISVDETRELVEPDGIIPFAFDQKRAINAIVEWGKKRKIRPDGRVSFPVGVYLPAWTFDFGGEIPYTAQIVVEDRQSRRKVVVKTISDTYPVLFNDFSVPATRKQPKLLEQALPGYKFNVVTSYDPRFLADWLAEVYEIAMSDASLDARSKIAERYKDEIRVSLETQYQNVSNIHQSSADITIESFKLILVPVWFTSYSMGAQKYNVLVNGQTGDVHGEYPKISWLDSLFK